MVAVVCSLVMDDGYFSTLQDLKNDFIKILNVPEGFSLRFLAVFLFEWCCLCDGGSIISFERKTFTIKKLVFNHICV